MKKIRSFEAALILFLAFTMLVHTFATSIDLNSDREAFGFWFSSYKDLSYNALAENMTDDTILLMGSSEFRHGRKGKYHPKNIFAAKDIQLMSIGGHSNQMLFHTIALGSLEPYLKSKKVVVLISPTWFRKSGVTPQAYALRYSDTEYYAFMENPNIPRSTKEYVATRSEKLLEKDPSKYHQVRNINQVALYGNQSFLQKTMYRIRKFYATDRDYTTMALALQSIGKDQATTTQTLPGKTIAPDIWKELAKKAIRNDRNKTDNEFSMTPYAWKKFQRIYPKFKDRNIDDNFDISPEYADLEAFLQVCSSNGIQAKLVILPINGRWFDYTGRNAEKRAVINKRVQQLAKQYGAEYASLSKYDYTDCITRDAVHPWNEGWIRIDEEIYKFKDKNQK